MNTKKSSSYI